MTAGVLRREVSDGHPEYVLTEAGRALWPVVYLLTKWGEQYTSGPHPARVYSHADCDTDVDDVGHCASCGYTPDPADLIVRPGSGPNAMRRDDRVARALAEPHRILTPLEISS